MFNKFDFDIENIKRDFQIENMQINASDVEMLRKYIFVFYLVMFFYFSKKIQ